MTTTYQICLNTEVPGREDYSVIQGTYVLTFPDKESADQAIPVLRVAINQRARCGKVCLFSHDLDVVEAERRANLWNKLDLPEYIWLTGIRWYRRVETEELELL